MTWNWLAARRRRPRARITKRTLNRAALKTYRQRYHDLAVLGGSLFGPLPDGRSREFFALDARTWIWHERWVDETGPHTVTTCYELRPDGIYKRQGDRPAERVTQQEEYNLQATMNLYNQRLERYPQIASMAA